VRQPNHREPLPLNYYCIAMAIMRCYVSGRVQGVFFRASTRDRARQLGLVGRVSNLPDGRVEVIASGPEADLAALRRWLQTGPPQAAVSGLECVPCAEQAFEGFAIR
jgi:acylphosphatase